MKSSEDRNIAAAVHCGTPGSVERFVRSYQDGLFRYALGLLGDAFDAQEVVQDGFLRACAALTKQYDKDTCRNLAVRPWLYRITRNLAFNRRRSRRARRETPMGGEELIRAADSSASAGSPRMERTVQARDSLSAGLARVAAGDRELLLLRFVDGLPYADIAAVLGTNEAAARGRVFRATRRLRDAVRRMEGDDEV